MFLRFLKMLKTCGGCVVKCFSQKKATGGYYINRANDTSANSNATTDAFVVEEIEERAQDVPPVQVKYSRDVVDKERWGESIRLRKEKEKADYEEIMANIKPFKIVVRENDLQRLYVKDMPEIKIAFPPRNGQRLSTVCNYIVIDVETTGLNVRGGRIVELSAVRFVDFLPTEYFSTLINPQKNIPSDASAINGITNDMVNGQPIIGEVAEAFIEFLGSEKILIGHNITFDLSFLYVAGIDVFNVKRKFFDTCDTSRARIKPEDVGNYKLSTLLDYCHIYSPILHRGLEDCIATGILFRRLINI